MAGTCPKVRQWGLRDSAPAEGRGKKPAGTPGPRQGLRSQALTYAVNALVLVLVLVLGLGLGGAFEDEDENEEEDERALGP